MENEALSGLGNGDDDDELEAEGREYAAAAMVWSRSGLRARHCDAGWWSARWPKVFVVVVVMVVLSIVLLFLAGGRLSLAGSE